MLRPRAAARAARTRWRRAPARGRPSDRRAWPVPAGADQRGGAPDPRRGGGPRGGAGGERPSAPERRPEGGYDTTEQQRARPDRDEEQRGPDGADRRGNTLEVDDGAGQVRVSRAGPGDEHRDHGGGEDDHGQQPAGGGGGHGAEGAATERPPGLCPPPPPPPDAPRAARSR